MGVCFEVGRTWDWWLKGPLTGYGLLYISSTYLQSRIRAMTLKDLCACIQTGHFFHAHLYQRPCNVRLQAYISMVPAARMHWFFIRSLMPILATFLSRLTWYYEDYEHRARYQSRRRHLFVQEERAPPMAMELVPFEDWTPGQHLPDTMVPVC